MLRKAANAVTSAGRKYAALTEGLMALAVLAYSEGLIKPTKAGKGIRFTVDKVPVAQSLGITSSTAQAVQNALYAAHAKNLTRSGLTVATKDEALKALKAIGIPDPASADKSAMTKALKGFIASPAKARTVTALKAATAKALKAPTPSARKARTTKAAPAEPGMAEAERLGDACDEAVDVLPTATNDALLVMHGRAVNLLAAIKTQAEARKARAA